MSDMSDKRKVECAVRLKVWEKMGDKEIMILDKTNPNVTTLVGLDSMARYSAGITGGGQISKIGTGNGTTVANDANDRLYGASQLIKSITGTNKSYVRPTLYVSVEYGYNEGNYDWNELGLFDNNDILLARQTDSTPLEKDNTRRAIVEWQVTFG